MAFQDFAADQYIKTVDTGEEIRVGSFQTIKNLELKYIRLTIYIDGAIPTNEQVRVNIYSDIGTTSKIFSSEWSNLSEINGVSSRWLGWVRTDFDRQNINKELIYYPTIELNNYTRVPGSYYIGFCYDFPFPIYDNSEDLFYNHPLQMQLFGYSNRD